MEITKKLRNSSMSDEGMWVDNIPGMDDLRLKVRSSNSRVVRREMSRLTTENIDNQKDDRRDHVIALTLAEVVLIDWDNLTVEGEVLPYNKELATQWLTNPDMDEFYHAVEWASIQVSVKSKEATAELAKNLVRSSSGK